jgi:hypothetical protein
MSRFDLETGGSRGNREDREIDEEWEVGVVLDLRPSASPS